MSEHSLFIRCAFWNLDGRARPKSQPEYLARIAPDVALLAEVTEPHFEAILKSGAFAWGEFSLSIRPPRKDEGRSRRLGCALFGRQHLTASDMRLLDLPFAERSLVASIEGNGITFAVCVFHAPPGASHGKIKPQSMVSVADWLSAQDGPILLGMDANAPKEDHWNHSSNVYWWKDEPALLGKEPVHHLSDLYRTFLRENPKYRVRDDPLAVSYKRGRGSDRTDCRYDFLYGTNEFQPRFVHYPYEQSIAAGSDHAAVIADVELSC